MIIVGYIHKEHEGKDYYGAIVKLNDRRFKCTGANHRTLRAALMSVELGSYTKKCWHDQENAVNSYVGNRGFTFFSQESHPELFI